jgi:ABC-type amino acid transport substrate-binding protein
LVPTTTEIEEQAVPVRFKFALAVWMLWAGAATATAADQGDTLAAAKPAGKASLSVLWVASEGWAHKNQEGRPVGVTVELMERFAEWVEREHAISLQLEFEQEENWTTFYQRVRSADGGVFGLGNVTITEARREELAFSPPYVNNVAVLISQAGDAELTAPEQMAKVFADQRALAFADTLHEQRLRALQELHWPDLPLDFSRSNDEILAAAAAGTHFAYIDGYNYFRAVDRGLAVRRHAAFDDPGEQFGIIMPLNNDWQPLLDDFFAAEDGLVGQPWYQALLAEWLGDGVARLLSH